jgi:8-oxo-dGTP diphosphatase
MRAKELDEFLNAHPEYVAETIEWGPLRFAVRSFLCSAMPPPGFVTSVRAIVSHQGMVLVVRDPESTHIIPGGRCEPGEVWQDTLQREIAEETGWRILNMRLLGIRHFHHLSPKPPEYKYPYPDFCQIIYHAEAVEFDPTILDPGRYEQESVFRRPEDLQNLKLTPCERHFLDAVLRSNRQTSER